MLSEAEFLELARAKYAQIAALEQSKNFYEHEKTFEGVWVELGRQVLEASISAVPVAARKKK
jgi:hypothetical protein